jgi:hypothetical protein
MATSPGHSKGAKGQSAYDKSNVYVSYSLSYKFSQSSSLSAATVNPANDSLIFQLVRTGLGVRKYMIGGCKCFLIAVHVPRAGSVVQASLRRIASHSKTYNESKTP